MLQSETRIRIRGLPVIGVMAKKKEQRYAWKKHDKRFFFFISFIENKYF